MDGPHGPKGSLVSDGHGDLSLPPESLLGSCLPLACFPLLPGLLSLLGLGCVPCSS